MQIFELLLLAGECGNVRSIRTSRAYKRNSSFVFRVRMKFRCYFGDSARERERELFHCAYYRFIVTL
uniref:Uncharacterized protein n=1 Tax=Trichogramma kaykai TaxID=54128 RepID=A0ABD2WAT2_9HYME